MTLAESIQLKKDRIELARERVIDMARLVVYRAHDDAYKAALASRVRELDVLQNLPTKHATS